MSYPLSINNEIFLLNGSVLDITVPSPEIYVTPTGITNVTYLGTYYDVNVCGNPVNTTMVTDACNWIVPASSSVSPSDPPGTTFSIQICDNIYSSCRSGVVCFTPTCDWRGVGETKCVTICQSTGDTTTYVTPTEIINISYAGASYTNIKVCGLPSNTTSVVSASNWITVCNTPISPSASPGTSSCICVSANTKGDRRESYVTYTPTAGDAKYVCVCQCADYVCMNLCQTYNSPTNCTSYYAYTEGDWRRDALMWIPTSGSYSFSFYWYIYKSAGSGTGRNSYWCVFCNGNCLTGCTVTMSSICSCSGTICLENIDYNDNICFYLRACKCSGMAGYAYACVYTNSVFTCQTYPNFYRAWCCYCLVARTIAT